VRACQKVARGDMKERSKRNEANRGGEIHFLNSLASGRKEKARGEASNSPIKRANRGKQKKRQCCCCTLIYWETKPPNPGT